MYANVLSAFVCIYLQDQSYLAGVILDKVLCKTEISAHVAHGHV